MIRCVCGNERLHVDCYKQEFERLQRLARIQTLMLVFVSLVLMILSGALLLRL
jgi:hypothetical protein